MTPEQQSALLSEFDFRVLIDTSGSMATDTDTSNGMSRLAYAGETTT